MRSGIRCIGAVQCLLVTVLIGAAPLSRAQVVVQPCKHPAQLFYQQVDSVVAYIQRDRLTQRKLYRWVSKGQPKACNRKEDRVSVSPDFFSRALASFQETKGELERDELALYCTNDSLKARGSAHGCLRLYFTPPVLDYVVVDVAIAKDQGKGPLNRVVRYLFVFAGAHVQRVERKQLLYM